MLIHDKTVHNRDGRMWTTARDTSRLLGVRAVTLRKWSDEGKIKSTRTPCGQRLYDVEEFKTGQQEKKSPSEKKYVYCRVSSPKQKEDLQRQIEDMSKAFPGYEILTDIGSGVNFKRTNLQRLLRLSSKGLVAEIAIAHRDRLCRFAFELLEYIFSLKRTKIVVHGGEKSGSSSFDELSQDLMAVTSVFICRMQGRRAADNKRRRKQTVEAKTGGDQDDVSSNPGVLHAIPEEFVEAMDGLL